MPSSSSVGDDVDVEAARLPHQPQRDRAARAAATSAAGPTARRPRARPGASARSRGSRLRRRDRDRARRRITSAPSSRASSMLPSRWRWASASICSGDSRGVSTKTTNQSVLRRPASREPLRTQGGAACGERDDRQTITRLAGAHGRRARLAGSAATGRALARSMLSATSRSASSRSWRQVLRLEEVLQRPRDLVGRVDLPRPQALLQILDGEVQVHDLVGLLEEAVGNGLAHRRRRSPARRRRSGSRGAGR